MNQMNDSLDMSPTTDGKTKVSLKELAELTGFPTSMIQNELSLKTDHDLDLDELRNVLAQYLDKSFFMDDKAN